MKYKKIITVILGLLFILSVLAVFLLLPSPKISSYTFETETGDKIRVELDTGAGHRLIKKEEEILVSDKDIAFTLVGIFAPAESQEMYEMEFTDISDEPNILDSGYGQTKAGQSYHYVAYLNDDGTTKVKIFLRIPSTDCGVVFNCDRAPGLRKTRNAFNRLKFSAVQ